MTTDNKALADLIEAAQTLGHHSALRSSSDDTIAYWSDRVRKLQAAISPQADKARGEVVGYVDLRELQEVGNATAWADPRPDHAAIYTSQPQGDASGQLGDFQDKALAWDAVYEALTSVARGWTDNGRTGLEAAVNTIRKLATPQARPVDDSTDYDCPDCGKLNYKPLRCQNCGHDPEQARPDEPKPERRAPVQRYHGKTIPWRVHGLAWEAYAKKYGRAQSAERLAERGGFGIGEMDEHLPGWRDMVDAIDNPAPAPDVARTDWPAGIADRIKAAAQRIQDNRAPRRIPADPTDVDLVLAEVEAYLSGEPAPFWLTAAQQEGE